MKLEISLDGKTWSPLENLYELEGFLQGVDAAVPNWKVLLRKRGD